MVMVAGDSAELMDADYTCSSSSSKRLCIRTFTLALTSNCELPLYRTQLMVLLLTSYSLKG